MLIFAQTENLYFYPGIPFLFPLVTYTNLVRWPLSYIKRQLDVLKTKEVTGLFNALLNYWIFLNFFMNGSSYHKVSLKLWVGLLSGCNYNLGLVRKYILYHLQISKKI